MADHQTPPALPKRQSSLSIPTPPTQSQADGAPPLPPRPPPGGRRPTATYHDMHPSPPNVVLRRNTHSLSYRPPSEGAYVTTTHHPYDPQLMPRLDSTRIRKDFPPLEEQEWYWGNISKEDVTELMKDRPDGSFLVRDAARNPGNYTLTLRKDGVNRLIRIMYRDGYYGFAEPLEFLSVMELVDYYKTNSLHPYSPKLDITLKEAVSRLHVYSDMDNEVTFGRSGQEPATLDSVAKMYRETEEELKEKSNYYNDLSERYERTTKEILEMRLDLAAQQQIITILKEHLTVSEKANKEDAASDVKQNLLKNYQLLKRRFSTQEHSHKNLEATLHRKETQKNQLDMERNFLKPVLKELQQKSQNQLRYLNQHGYRTSEMLAEAAEDNNNPDDLYTTYAMLHTYRADAADYQRITDLIQRKRTKPLPVPPQGAATTSYSPVIDQTLQRHYRPPVPYNEYDGGQVITREHLQNIPPNLPHFQESTWMRPHISREESRDLLQGRPDGTFLVRPKPSIPEHSMEPVHTHTIDIMDVGKYKRIPIFCGPNGGYGFAHPYEFDSIPTLVLYYAVNNMSRHNESLQNTSLLHPAFLKY